MSKYIDDAADGGDAEKLAKDDALLAVRFTTEDRLNHAMMTKIADINLAHENKAELLEVAGKFDEAKAEREKKLSDAPVYRKVEFVTIKIPGDKTFYVHRPVMAADKARFRAKYEAFKNQTGEPVEGTPVEQLPEIKPSQITDLKYVGVTTIEQLAKVSDGSPLMSMMGGVGLKQRADAWVKKNRRSSVVTQTNEALKERDDKIAKMEEQIAALIAVSEAGRADVAAKVARK
jgi:hypothetical protein